RDWSSDVCSSDLGGGSTQCARTSSVSLLCAWGCSDRRKIFGQKRDTLLRLAVVSCEMTTTAPQRRRHRVNPPFVRRGAPNAPVQTPPPFGAVFVLPEQRNWQRTRLVSERLRVRIPPLAPHGRRLVSTAGEAKVHRPEPGSTPGPSTRYPVALRGAGPTSMWLSAPRE